MAIKKRAPGRPAKPQKDKKGEHITCWMTADTKALITRAAEQAGDAPGTWLRKVGERAARFQLENGA